jgi:hypothetical protein
MNNAPAIVRRILLRLDPGRGIDGRLAAAARLAAALHAELAARLVSDTRIESALAFAGAIRDNHKEALSATSVETIFRRAETTLRQTVSTYAERERAVWSFEVVHCAGALTGSVLEAEDLVAIELARLETIPSDLRTEVAAALEHARGVILFPAAPYPSKGPVVAIVAGEQEKSLVAVSREIAAAVGEQMTVLTHGTAYDTAGLATAVRRQKAILAIADAADPLAQEFLRRPRFLRELAAPFLLLKAR